MNDDEALLVADNADTGFSNHLAALKKLAEVVRRQHAEIESFCMEYRMKCDVETKAQAVEIERLQAQLDASRRDAERAAGTASKLADQRLTTRVEADIETQRWQARVNAEIESACSNRVLTAADETRLRDFIDATVGVKP